MTALQVADLGREAGVNGLQTLGRGNFLFYLLAESFDRDMLGPDFNGQGQPETGPRMPGPKPDEATESRCLTKGPGLNK